MLDLDKYCVGCDSDEYTELSEFTNQLFCTLCWDRQTVIPRRLRREIEDRSTPTDVFYDLLTAWKKAQLRLIHEFSGNWGKDEKDLQEQVWDWLHRYDAERSN